MTRNKGRLKRVLLKLPLILFGILIGAFASEVALRILGYSYPEFYQLDYSRGYSLRPGMEGWYRKEGSSFVRINSDGLRDREHSTSKPADTFRIAVVGDSYPEALQVPQEQAFWSIMQAQLTACGSFAGKKIEAINFGVSGYGTAQELITLREKVWKYSPDIVMLTVTTNNDITDNFRSLKNTEEIPYFVLDNGRLVLDDSFKVSRPFRLRQSNISRFGRWLKDHFRLVQAINEGHRAFKLLLSSWKDRFKVTNSLSSTELQQTVSSPRIEDVGIDNQIYLEPSDSAWTEAWRVTEALIKEMNDEVKSHCAEFVVVTLTNTQQVAPNRRARQEFMKRIGSTDLFYPDFRIRAFAERQGIQVISLAPEMQAYADQNSVYLHGFEPDIGNGHWNSLGHRIAGEMIARKLCESLPVK